MKKQILSALLASACAVSMVTPAFADDPEYDANSSGKQTVTTETNFQDAVIHMNLPATADVIVNPYQAGYVDKGENEDDESDDVTYYESLVSPDMKFESASECAVTVAVEGFIQTYQIQTIGSTWTKVVDNGAAVGDYDLDVQKLETAGLSLDGYDVYIEAEGTKNTVAAAIKTGTTIDTTSGSAGKLLTSTYTVATDSANAKLTVTGFKAATNIKVASTSAKSVSTNSIYMYATVLDEKGEYAGYSKTARSDDTKDMLFSAKLQSVDVLKVKSGTSENMSVGYIKFAGDVATSPKTAWKEALASEGFDVILAWNLKPSANELPVVPDITSVSLKAWDSSSETVSGSELLSAADEDGNYSVSVTASGSYKLEVAASAENKMPVTISVTCSGEAIDESSYDDNTGVLEIKNVSNGSAGVVTVTVSERNKSTSFNINLTVA